MGKGKRPKAFTKRVIRDLHREAVTESVNAPGGIADTAQNPHMPDGERLAMLVRSFGLVADCVNDDRLYGSLILLSGRVLSWAQVVKESEESNQQWTT